MSQGNQPWQPPSGQWQQPPQPGWAGQSGPSINILPGDNADIASRASRWVFGQPAIVVMTFLQTSGLGWIVWYPLTTAIPNHDNKISAMFAAKDETHKSERRDDLQRFIDALSAQQAQFEKDGQRHERWFEAIEKRHGEKAAAAAAMAPEKPEGNGGT